MAHADDIKQQLENLLADENLRRAYISITLAVIIRIARRVPPGTNEYVALLDAARPLYVLLKTSPRVDAQPEHGAEQDPKEDP